MPGFTSAVTSQDAMSRPRVPTPEGAGKSARAIRISVMPMVVNRPPFLVLSPPRTCPTKMIKLVPGFTRTGRNPIESLQK